MSDDPADSSAPGDGGSRGAVDLRSDDVGGHALTHGVGPDGVPHSDRAQASSLKIAVPLLAVTVVFLVVALVRSQMVGISMRDPHGLLFFGRIPRALGFGLGLAVLDVVLRTVRLRRRTSPRRGAVAADDGRETRPGSRPSLGASLLAMTRARWPWRRLVLVVVAVVAYYTVYVSYRNLKSWDVLNTPRDESMLALDRAIFFGHAPGPLLHDLFGTDHAAVFFSFIYSSFTDLVVITVVGAIFLIGRARESYVFVLAACWAWIIGTISYYLIPTLGPFASAPQQFTSLRHTHVNHTWAADLAGRLAVLDHPGNPHSFAGISAFASLHTGFTAMVLFMAGYYGWKRTRWVLTGYLALIVVSTIYFGWHFVADDVAGLVLAYAAVWLARLMTPREPVVSPGGAGGAGGAGGVSGVGPRAPR